MSRLPATARREQILDVALGVFATAGFYGASMNDVADAVGVTKPVLYQHFDSKHDLYRALIDEAGNRMLTSIGKATANTTDGREGTDRGFAAYFRWVAEDGEAFRFLFSSGTRRDDDFSSAIREITAQAANAVAPLIDVEIDAEHRMTIAHALVGMAEGASRQLVQRGGDFDPDEIAEAISSLAWAGLRAVQPLDADTS
ncbi:MAG: TetR/AcrR family transcriptional regulator [Actinomycetota bacterium]